MELFVRVFFWIGLIGCILRMAIISYREYPHQTTESLGLDVVRLFEGAVFVIWAAILLWGRS